MSNRRIWTEDKLQKIETLAEKGYSKKEIAKEFNVSEDSILWACHDNKIKTQGKIVSCKHNKKGNVWYDLIFWKKEYIDKLKLWLYRESSDLFLNRKYKKFIGGINGCIK